MDYLQTNPTCESLHLVQVSPSPLFYFLVLVLLEARSLRPEA